MKVFLKGKCPCCGKGVVITNKGYHCTSCSFQIPGYICNRHISPSEASAIINDKRIILDGFASDDGKIFSSIPVLFNDTVRLDNTIVRCYNRYNEERGRIIVGRRFFKCENNGKCRNDCPFVKGNKLRRSIDGHMVTYDDVVKLFKFGSLRIKTYSDNGEVTYKTLSYIKEEQDAKENVRSMTFVFNFTSECKV